MTSLVSSLLDRALKGFRVFDTPDVLTANIDASVTSVPYEGFVSGWAPSTLAEIGSELMMVKEVDSENQIATVVRGWLDTTAVAHNAQAPIFLNPRMLRSDLMDLVNDCLDDMFGQDLYTTGVVSFTYDSSLIGYNLSSDVVRILRVDAQTEAFSKQWDTVMDWIYIDNADTTDFASGKGLMLRRALPYGAKVRVVYSKPFTQVTSEAQDLEANAGLAPYMTDIPYYFLMSRMMSGAETRRSQIQGAQNHQRAQDSPPFLAMRTGEWYQARYLDRIRSARARLKKEVKVPIGSGYGS